jgi:hypothetical protein
MPSARTIIRNKTEADAEATRMGCLLCKGGDDNLSISSSAKSGNSQEYDFQQTKITTEHDDQSSKSIANALTNDNPPTSLTMKIHLVSYHPESVVQPAPTDDRAKVALGPLVSSLAQTPVKKQWKHVKKCQNFSLVLPLDFPVAGGCILHTRPYKNNTRVE